MLSLYFYSFQFAYGIFHKTKSGHFFFSLNSLDFVIRLSACVMNFKQ